MFQNFEIIGNLGREPEMRYSNSGTPVTSFSVAVNRSYNDANGSKVEETMWVRVSAWSKLAEVCNQYLHKGSKVFVSGRLNIDTASGGPRVWTRQDGTPSASFEMTADRVVFLSNKSETTPETEAAGEDIPF